VRAGLDRGAWIVAARKVLIQGGIGAVKIGKLAARLRVSRESFYWHFKDLSELHRELLRDWQEGNSALYRALIDPARRDGEREFREMVELWLEERRYDPRWDAAVRDWARTSPAVARTVARVDELRIGIIRAMFLDMGYDEVEALIRARITYYHQVGYYTIAPRQSPPERRRLAPVYVRLLTGRPILG
jgi:AcrR family transcriptional regulator